MLCCIPFVWLWFLPAELIRFSKSVIANCLFVSNFLFWKETGYFASANELKPLLHTWSLAVEEQFYLVFPVFFLYAWRWKRKGLLQAVISVFLLSFGIMSFLRLDHPSANFYLAPPRVWEFLLGTLIALTIDSIQAKAKSLSSLFVEIVAFAGLAFLISSFFTFTKQDSFPNVFALIPLLGASLIILFATSNTIVGKILSVPPLVGIGLISYSIYLWHQPIFVFARRYRLVEPKPEIYGILIVSIIIISFVSWKLIEQPFRRKNLLNKKQALFSYISMFLFLVTCGVLGITKSGFPKRFENSKVNFVGFFDTVQAISLSTKYPSSIGMGYNHTTGKFRDSDHFISDWKSLVSKELKYRSPILAMFGDSHAGNMAKALTFNGISPLILYGSSCPVSPDLMNERCKKLADLMKESLKRTPSIKYLALIRYFKDGRDLGLDQIKRTVSFWSDVNIQLLFFSERPDFPYIQQILQAGGYPQPRFDSSELSLRQEVRAYLASEGVHLVNVKEAFCKITPSCTFKVGDSLSFEAKDMLLFDEHHLSDLGCLKLGKILIETDPVLNNIWGEYQKTYLSNSRK